MVSPDVTEAVERATTALAALAPGGLLAFARVAGLCATAPVIGDGDVPPSLRFGLALVLGAALAPLRGAVELSVSALAVELALGLIAGTAARFALAAVETAGQLIGISLGLGFAEQYDPRHGEAAGIVQVLARTVAALAFVGAGGLAAMVRAAATPADLTALPGGAAAALALATSAATWGLGLAAPIVLAALLGNLALALAHRAAAALNLFAVGLAASLLVGGLALLATSAQLAAGMRAAAGRAVDALTDVAALDAPRGTP